MKKAVLILMLALVVLMAGFAAGCANNGADANANGDNTTAQNGTVNIEAVDAYLASVISQSDAINTALEEDATLTQLDMNTKVIEQSELWSDALDYMMDALEKHLSEDEFAKLQNDQAEWAANKDTAVAEAGAGFEGGSFYSFIVGSEDAKLTEERVFELYEMLKQA